MSTLPAGQRVVVSALSETPDQAIAQHMSLVAMPPPDPATLGPTDVIVAVKSAAVGWVDLLMTMGQYQHLPQPPYCPGLEWAGDVVWKGPDVRTLAVGDRVNVDGMLAGPRSLGPYQQYGGFASYAVAPEGALMKVPGELSYDEACSLLGSYETAWHCLFGRGRLRAGETVLVHGASGSTGLAAVHLAKLAGATVIATGRSGPKLEQVKQQGADHVVSVSDLKTLREQVKGLTGGAGVDVVYDGVGGDLSVESLRCVKFGARFLIVGWAATPYAGRTKAPPNQLPTNLIMMKGVDVLGCPTVIGTLNDPSIRKPRIAQLLGWVEAGKLTPFVSKRWPLSAFKEALTAKWKGEIVGAGVVTP
ncbi:MAG: NADPH:quinone oxidoreductase family protein [Myxococcaceae bacterium]|nr:NADPH:quinone oxidoreductase family protein [Myxococcaceae bacterium]